MTPRREKLVDAVCVAFDMHRELANHCVGAGFKTYSGEVIRYIVPPRTEEFVGMTGCRMDPRDLWKKLALRRVIPRAWAARSTRRSFEAVARIGRLKPTKVLLPHPPSIDACLVFASDVAVVRAVERMTMQTHGSDRHIVWRCASVGDYCFDSVLDGYIVINYPPLGDQPNPAGEKL